MRTAVATFLTFIAAFALDTGAAAQPPAAAQQQFTIPFELYGGRIYVRVHVNGRGPYRFGFDTGASGMGRADTRLVAELSLPKAGDALNSDGVNVAAIDVVRVNSLRLGAIEKRDVELLSRDYNRNAQPGAPLMLGIVGADMLADHLVTIDYPGRTLTFGTGELKAGEPGVIAYSGNFVVPVCFASGCYPGQVDTGSNAAVVIPKDLVGKVAAGDPVAVGTGRGANTVMQMYEMDLRELIRIGKVTAGGLKVRYADPSIDRINVGSAFLKDYVLTIDSRNRLLRLERPAPAHGERG